MSCHIETKLLRFPAIALIFSWTLPFHVVLICFVTLVAFSGNTKPGPYHLSTVLQLFWRSGSFYGYLIFSSCPPGQNGRHFGKQHFQLHFLEWKWWNFDSHFNEPRSFNCIFLNENDRILIQISLKYVPRNRINNKPALGQVMAWHQIGDKPLPEPMMTQSIDAYMRH